MNMTLNDFPPKKGLGQKASRDRRMSVPSSHNKNSKKNGRTNNQGRSRAGCVTCKAKHTKCDETRPECLKCSRRGVKCGGYWREFKWSFKHQPDSGEAPSQDSEAASTTSNSPSQVVSQDFASALEKLFPDTSVPIAPRTSASSSSQNSEDALDLLLPRFEDMEWVANPELEMDAFSTFSLPNFLDEDVSPTTLVDPVYDISANAPPPPPVPTQDTELTLFRAPPIIDSSSVLIVNWFEQVCPAWSAFDSKANLNREIANSLWQDSQVVYDSLQSMSASFLATRLPWMNKQAVDLMQKATRSIRIEIQAVRGQEVFKTLPTGLLFSLFALGTTVCWVDASQLGLPFLREAKSLLDRLNKESTLCSFKESEILPFFNKCLTYCEMLLAAAGNEELLPETTEKSARDSTSRSFDKTEEGTDVAPHPWTGISANASILFTQSISLCRRFRHHVRGKRNTARDLQNAMAQIQIARALEERLLELDFGQISSGTDTGDQRTPWLHLETVAEAYQLSALLHLYQTFPDLICNRLPLEAAMSDNDYVPWEKWIIPLSLRLTKVLERIPPDSGSRVIQPLLYISASTGLRYDALTLFNACHQASNTQAEPTVYSFCDTQDLSSDTDADLSATEMIPAPSLVSKSSIDISNARHFIMQRLSMLENSLPPKPIRVAKELVRMIWQGYDNEPPQSTSVHWVDVMEESNLRTMFG